MSVASTKKTRATTIGVFDSEPLSERESGRDRAMGGTSRHGRGGGAGGGPGNFDSKGSARPVNPKGKGRRLRGAGCGECAGWGERPAGGLTPAGRGSYIAGEA